MTLLQLLGPAAVPTLICLAVGLVMLIIEMFTPGFGAARCWPSTWIGMWISSAA